MNKNKSKPSIAKRLSAYSTLAAATAVAGGSANAGEIVHDIPDFSVSHDSNVNLQWNMTAGSYDAVANGGTPGASGSFYILRGNIERDPSTNGGFAASQKFATYSGGSYYMATPVTEGSVTSGLNFYNQPWGLSNWAYTALPIGEAVFIGLKFEIRGATHYGWAQVTRDTSNDITLHGFGYNDTADTASVTRDTVDAVISDDVEVTDFSVSDGIATITIKGKADTDYVCKQSLILSGFTEIPGSTTTTDGSGVATFMVPATGPKRFYLVEE